MTWGIGYDGGQQTAATIRSDWAAHADVDRLATTAGKAGTGAQALARSLRTVTTPLPLAMDVFSNSTLPRYHAAARRALGDGFDYLPEHAQGALDSLGYRRGWAMGGPNRREMREIRDTCVPARDVHCIAAQIRSDVPRVGRPHRCGRPVQSLQGRSCRSGGLGMTEVAAPYDAKADRRYASRKFILAAAAFLAGGGFLLGGLISPEQWQTFIQWIVGLYMVGNVGDTLAERVTP